jgi:hypothetical protein
LNQNGSACIVQLEWSDDEEAGPAIHLAVVQEHGGRRHPAALRDNGAIMLLERLSGRGS